MMKSKNPTVVDGIGQVLFGIIIFVVAYYFYDNVTSYENGESLSINRLLFIGYNVLGKHISVGIISLIGTVFAYRGIKQVSIAAKVKKWS